MGGEAWPWPLPIKIGDIVVVGSENQKRINCPIARVQELFPSGRAVHKDKERVSCQGEDLTWNTHSSCVEVVSLRSVLLKLGLNCMV
ncbi:hypothetical protein NPIL_609271 [Nephila pilipes]|uniref:Uncharacterized protein n=1 Tax=Nephila pilipes TaxID=299642 RepID=A0A8X6MN16_NEPPI|nr:hypothetical protein NPIL_609271 [Nephila pilipes]